MAPRRRPHLTPWITALSLLRQIQSCLWRRSSLLKAALPSIELRATAALSAIHESLRNIFGAYTRPHRNQNEVASLLDAHKPCGESPQFRHQKVSPVFPWPVPTTSKISSSCT